MAREHSGRDADIGQGGDAVGQQALATRLVDGIRLALDERGGQTMAGTDDRGGHTGRAAAHDHDIWIAHGSASASARDSTPIRSARAIAFSTLKAPAVTTAPCTSGSDAIS